MAEYASNVHPGERDIDIAALIPRLAKSLPLFHGATRLVVSTDIYEKMAEAIDRITEHCEGFTILVDENMPKGYVIGQRRYPEGLGLYEIVYIQGPPLTRD